MSDKSNIIAKVGPVVVVVAGGSVLALSTATVLVAAGAAVAVSAAGYGVYKWLSRNSNSNDPPKEPPKSDG